MLLMKAITELVHEQLRRSNLAWTFLASSLVFAHAQASPGSDSASHKMMMEWVNRLLAIYMAAFEDVSEMVKKTEATINRYVNGFLAASIVFLLIALIRKYSIQHKNESG